jgi:ferredoxin-NADP reductase
MFRPEIERIARARGARVAFLVGSRAEHPDYLTSEHLSRLLPDITAHDVYVCGPPSMIADVEDALRQLRVPARQIHTEKFEL